MSGKAKSTTMEVDAEAAEDSNPATSGNEEDPKADEEDTAVENGEKQDEVEEKSDKAESDESKEKKEKSEDGSKKKKEEEQIHKCGDCGAKFTVRHKLMRHINTNHNRRRTGDGPFTCEDCNITYAFRSKFNKHKPFCPNKKNRPYVCVECTAGFDEKVDFHDHIRVHNWPSFDP